MSVFTSVTPEQLSAWLKQYSIGALQDLRGILSGIENTNYFVTTTHGRFVLTLFEKLKPSELPFYLNLMAHLCAHGIACPRPVANLRNEYLGELNGRPAAIVSRMSGAPQMQPTAHHCARVGELLADLHLAGQSYTGHLANLRGPQWWSAVAPEIYPFLEREEIDLLRLEIDHQTAQHRDDLPRGVVHADMFRDNVLFDGNDIGGVIDFYFACNDALIYDVAITLNDWCMGPDHMLDPARTGSFLSAYQEVRPLNANERRHLPVMLRAGALRFWVSRLYDLHLPRAGTLTHAHDPDVFRDILRNHIRLGGALPESLLSKGCP